MSTPASNSRKRGNSRNDDSDVDLILEEQVCWKCKGYGRKVVKNHPLKKDDDGNIIPITIDPNNHRYVGATCTECQGTGKRKVSSSKSRKLAQQPGQIPRLRGKNGIFAGVHAVSRLSEEDYDTTNTRSKIVSKGEILASLGCGNWRIFQLANGHKLTVDDFICAYVASVEMRKLGYGVQNGQFGQVPPDVSKDSISTFKHADIGCGCGSVLMTILWAFPKSIRSYGVEAQQVSYELCRRGIKWNLGIDVNTSDTPAASGGDDYPIVQLKHQDLRSWDGGNMAPYNLITGTPPYFPQDRFVASENSGQKIRCRVPTRGAASDYLETAARLIRSDGKGRICIVETSRKEAELAILETLQKLPQIQVLRRLDVITRTGLPPRFSCWVFTKRRISSSSGNGDNSNDNQVSSSNGETAAACTGTPRDESRVRKEKSETAHPAPSSPFSFPIGTLTIRNKDQSRTMEYVESLDIMGWVDFEQTKEKLEASKKLSTGATKPKD